MSAITPTVPQPARPDDGAHVHPLIHAGKGLAEDLLSTLMFVGVYALGRNVYLATGLAIAAGVAQFAWLKLRRQPIDLMQWMSLGLVVTFGGASLLTHDPRFMMLKPSLIYCAVGAVMMKRGWMNRYVPAIAQTWAGDVITAFGYGWSALMFATAALNLVLVANGDPKAWAWFVSVFPVASKLGLFAVQYLTVRAVIGRRMRRAGAAH